MKTPYKNGKRRAGWGVLALLLLANPAWAQYKSANFPPEASAEELPQLEQERNQLFTRMQQDPADLDVAFAYAILSARLGDLEGAAATYEAMLMRRPDAARVQLELAAIYYRLNALTLARQNFEAVAARPDVPDAVMSKINEYLAAINRQEWGGRTGLSGQITAGARYQSDANSAPNDRFVNTVFGRFEWDQNARAQSDVSTFFTGQVNWREPLGTHGHVIAAGLNIGLAGYNKVHAMSNQSIEARIGPDFALDQLGLQQARLGASVMLGTSRLGGEKYMDARGMTVNFQMPFNRVNQLSASLLWRHEDYDTNAQRPLGDDYDGNRLRMTLAYTRQLNERWQVFAGIFHENRTASNVTHAYGENGVNLGVNYRYASPFGDGSIPWVLGVMTQIGRVNNREPEPLLSLTDAQHGTEYNVQLVQMIPLEKTLECQVFLGAQGMNSNYDTRQFRDNYGGVSLTKRF
jgi:tetratricopeptide (TPR) repeat protein